jgi:hypothetical protein
MKIAVEEKGFENGIFAVGWKKNVSGDRVRL